MGRILTLDSNLQVNSGLWRTQVKFLTNISKSIHLFHVPELTDAFTPSIFEYIKHGNTEVRSAAGKCLVTLVRHNYQSQRRKELMDMIREELGHSNSSVLRKTFIVCCVYAI